MSEKNLSTYGIETREDLEELVRFSIEKFKFSYVIEINNTLVVDGNELEILVTKIVDKLIKEKFVEIKT